MKHAGQIGELENHHLFEITKTEDPHPMENLLEARAEEIRKRRKRRRKVRRNLAREGGEGQREGEEEVEEEEEVGPRDLALLDGIVWTEKQIPRKRIKRAMVVEDVPAELCDTEDTVDNRDSTLRRRAPVVGKGRLINPAKITDPGYDKQWFLENPTEVGNDLNVTGVWLDGVTGRNVNVALLDDGLDYESEDLKDNFFAAGSYDFNDHKPLPKPQLADDLHGTRCAGEIAAGRDNDVCGVGVAYKAKVAGIRILSAEISDADEAAALNYNYRDNHIMSCSWGPPDDGASVDAPRGIVAKAFQNGIKKGRNGKGTVFVFATGNGGGYGDNCNFDGYTNSVYTLTIGAIDRYNNHPYYSERCSAQIAVTYSSGAGYNIFTTDVGKNKCSAVHGGTSAAAPLGAGILALVLEVRPDLNWRDVQHLAIRTSIPVSLDDLDWQATTAGRKYNHKFGYGRLDAYGIVAAARGWKSVGPQTLLRILVTSGGKIPAGQEGLKSVVTVKDEQLKSKSVQMKRLEHVTVTVHIEHAQRGDVEIVLVSPHGLESRLAEQRQKDESDGGLRGWTFMTVKHWDEDPRGNWTLRLFDKINPDKTGTLFNWTLTLWGESSVRPPTPPSSSTKLDVSTAVSASVTGSVLSSSWSSPSDAPQQPSPPAAPPTPVSSPTGGFGKTSFAVGLVLVGGAAAGFYASRKRWWWTKKSDGALLEREFDDYDDDEDGADGRGVSMKPYSPVTSGPGHAGSTTTEDILDRPVLSTRLYEAFYDDKDDDDANRARSGGHDGSGRLRPPSASGPAHARRSEEVSLVGVVHDGDDGDYARFSSDRHPPPHHQYDYRIVSQPPQNPRTSTAPPPQGPLPSSAALPNPSSSSPSAAVDQTPLFLIDDDE